MNLPLRRPLPSVSHWVPGMVVLMVVVLSHFDWKYRDFIDAYAKNTPAATVTIVLFSIMAFVIGEVLDSVRDLFEYQWDKKHPVEWDYILDAPRDEVGRFEQYYFSYYVLNANLVLASILSLLMILMIRAGCVLFGLDWRPFAIGGAVIGTGIFLRDAIRLRQEVESISQERMKELKAKRKRSEEQTDSNPK